MEGVREGLKRLQEKYEIVADVRGKGLMLGIEFSPPKSLKLKAGCPGFSGIFALKSFTDLFLRCSTWLSYGPNVINFIHFYNYLN